jgi:hypothetical protein
MSFQKTQLQFALKRAVDAEAEVARLRAALQEIKADPVIAHAVAERALQSLDALVKQVGEADTWLRHTDAYETALKTLEPLVKIDMVCPHCGRFAAFKLETSDA